MFSYLYSVKGKTDSTIIIIATTVGGVVFLCIVLIVLLIKYKLRKRAPKVSVNIPLTVETPQQSLPIDQVNYLRMVSLELIEPPSIYKVSLVYVSSCSSTGSIRDDLFCTSRENSLELIEPSSMIN